VQDIRDYLKLLSVKRLYLQRFGLPIYPCSATVLRAQDEPFCVSFTVTLCRTVPLCQVRNGKKLEITWNTTFAIICDEPYSREPLIFSGANATPMSFSKNLRTVFGLSALAVALTSSARAQEAAKKPEAPVVTAVHGTPKIDGDIDDAWKDAPEVDVKKIVKSETTIRESEAATAKVKLMWDADNLYALFQVKDAKLSAKAGEDHAQDSIELFVDELNQKAGEYQQDDVQYRVNYEGKLSGAGPAYSEKNIKAVAKKVDGGYLVEMSVKLSHAKREAGTKMGLELQVNDDPDIAARGAVTKWNHDENDSYLSTSQFGTVLLQEKAK
jgi:Carbohydrate family 9 binding domain-like